MTLRTIPRAALGGSLKLIRLPLDLASRLAGRRGEALRVSADRTEASLLGVAGSLMADPDLKEDARLRGLAADERRHALELRAEAARHVAAGEEDLEEREEQADARRSQAKETTEQRRQTADRRRKAKAKQAGQTSRRRKQAADASAARAREEIEERAKRDRLAALDERAGALDQRGEALSAADESRRLATAAARVKAERKNGR